MAQLSKVNAWGGKWKNRKMNNARDHIESILCYVDFVNLCQFIKYFIQLNPNVGKGDINFYLSLISRSLEWQKILMNLNQVYLLLIQHFTMTSQSIKNISVETVFLQ